jgi:hypothetical protein
MKLWKISQTVNTTWDTYQAAVVAAPTEEAAKTIHPGSQVPHLPPISFFLSLETWCNPQDVQVTYLGTAKKGTLQGVILSHFKAG